MKKWTYISTFLLAMICLPVTSQGEVERIWNEIDSSETKGNMDLRVSRWNFNASFGTSFFISPYYGSSMGYFTAPHASYRATDRMSFQAGMIAMYGAMPGDYNDLPVQYQTGMGSLAFFIAATYRVTENLYIHGTGTRSLVAPGLHGSEILSGMNDYSIGATYDFVNFSIGASFHQSNNQFSRPPYGFGNPAFGGPIFW